jgi:hypothetical protein
MAKIIIRFQNQTVAEHPLRAGFNEIGRLAKNSIRIDNPGISRHHAVILGDAGGKLFVVEDLQSLNGTYVNKRRVQKHLLRAGDVVTLGQHSLEFVEEAPASDDSPGKPVSGPHLVDLASGKRYALTKDTLYFGNSSADDIQVPGLMAGKNFASLNRKGTAWVINLLVKRFSQLRLNGEEIHSAKLEDGDELEVAGVKFTFRMVGG